MKKLILTILACFLIVSVAFAGSQQTSSTLASTMITTVRYYLDEATADFWSDAELLVYLNQGIIEIVGMTKCIEGTESVTLLANTVEYSITGPYIDVTSVVYNDANGNKVGLTKKNPTAIGHSRDNIPAWWYEWSGKVGIFPSLPLITDAGLAIGSTTTAVSTVALSYIINNKIYSKAAVAAGTAPGNDIIPTGTYGAVAFDIGGDGTITAVEAYSNAAGYSSAALSVVGLPPVNDGRVRLGYVTATKSDGAFTFGTTALNAANSTVAYTDSAPTATVYFVSKPTAIASSGTVPTPAVYDKALIYYVVAQAHMKQRQAATATAFMTRYQAEIDRYRQDLVDQSQRAEEPVR